MFAFFVSFRYTEINHFFTTMLIRIILLLISIFSTLGIVSAANTVDSNVREVVVGETGNSNDVLNSFIGPIRSFFFAPGDGGSEGITGVFTTIAFQIKNFFIGIAVLFLIIGIIKLLFSSNDEESVKKWKSNIIWTSIGIFVMQISFSVWNTLVLKNDSDKIGSTLGWEFWINIFSPIVNLLQMLAAFGFLFMAVWAFFIMISA